MTSKGGTILKISGLVTSLGKQTTFHDATTSWNGPTLFQEVACVADAKRGGEGGGKKARKLSLFPFLPQYPLSTLATKATTTTNGCQFFFGYFHRRQRRSRLVPISLVNGSLVRFRIIAFPYSGPLWFTLLPQRCLHGHLHLPVGTCYLL